MSSHPVPFTVDIADAVLDRIRGRVAAFDWDGFADAGGWSAGVGIAAVRRLTDYWLDGYDWRAAERQLNAFPQYRVDIDGQQLHFVRVRGSAPRSLILIHGWPGSHFEFFKAIEPFAFPERFGGDPADGFDVIVPSLPGYGFSGPPASPIGPRHTANLFHRLMTDVLELPGYMVQGGDWGSTVGAWMAHDHPEACRALHLNLVLVQAEDALPETAEEKAHAAARQENWEAEGGYAHIQRTRPQTLSFAMHDSPVGTAAWMLEKFALWADLPRGADGPTIGASFDDDTLLTNIMLYLVTKAFATAAWMYKGRIDEGAASFGPGVRIEVPTGVAAFPDPVFTIPPRSQVEKSYHVVHWTDMPRGGHFAALEAPEALIADIRHFGRAVMP